jgi:lipid-A-disaccharide synthase
MKYFIIAGEASGDLHASNLMKALLEKDKQAIFVGLGGDKMQTICRLSPDGIYGFCSCSSKSW